MSTTPTLNQQVIGQAEYATRAVLDRLLARMDTTFHQWVALNLTAVSGGTLSSAELIGRTTGALKIDESAVNATIAGLAASELLELLPGERPRVRLTEAGQARYQQIRAALNDLTQRLYGDLPAEDLVVAGRVLFVITARANAELAGTQAH